ncbi:sensor histidine kinase [Gulosibacter sp. ACHW.36C]|uniref:Oxygen sensor histidine kinase NreB n=1 Tax=Gulosibacter sediminis TaxID=1729695 RepID=A0ABY4MYJ3_9MICO|nr:sensor histidine kinase [Gulosibacter sediminis]UQN15510.1 sensor histidine kinase [Gulosibacter sediminis]
MADPTAPSATRRIQLGTLAALSLLLAVLLWVPVLVAVADPITAISGRLGWMLFTAIAGTAIAAGVAVVVWRRPDAFGAPASHLDPLGIVCAFLLALPVASMTAFSVEGAYSALALFFIVLWLLPEGLGIVTVLVLMLGVVAGQAVHHGLGFGGVAGPVISAIAAVAVMWGYRMLVRSADENARLVTELRETQAALAATEREAGRVAERARLARDLHDTTAQHLSSIRLLAASGASLDEIERTSGVALREVRSIIAGLTPSELRDVDLAAALERLAVARPGVSFSASPAPWPLGIAASTALLRVTQEALNNAETHGEAPHVAVRLEFTEDAVSVEIDDDGVGFDAERWFEQPELAAARADGSGTGLRGLQARLRELGGFVSVVADPGEGTLVRAELPRPAAESRRS